MSKRKISSFFQSGNGGSLKKETDKQQRQFCDFMGEKVEIEVEVEVENEHDRIIDVIL